MNWFVAEVTDGVAIEGLQTGRRVHVSRTVVGTVRVIAGKGLTAVVRVEEARRRLRVVRRPDGTPVMADGQVRREIYWTERREARRFRGGVPSKLLV